jgi:pimeloyl-ACP methyl ester carboxylesterase
VKQVTKTRELFTLDCQGAPLHGTYHLATSFIRPNRTGILILPGFPMPRSAHGDAAVYWASSFADFGYPSFRIDLPGTGDSYGNVPAELLHFLTAGGYESVVVAAVKQLVDRYNLTGVVILGHCAGGISAIFAAASCTECRGLILLDPPFHQPPPGRRKVKKALFYWSSRSRLGGVLSNAYDHFKNIRLRLRKNAPPENANVALLRRWRDVASARLPILLLNAPAPKASATKPRVGKFDYLQHILKLAGRRNLVDVRTVENANHSFSNPLGRAAVCQHVEEWMPVFFPFEDQGQAAEDFGGPAASNNEAGSANPTSIFARVDATLREAEEVS